MIEKFFHSFPRPRKSSRNLDYPDGEKGLKILHGLINYGLILCPESFAFDSLEKTQCRASFSLSTRDELYRKQERTVGGQSTMVSHCDLFGHFSIGINHNVGRELGILPVVYHYDSNDGASISEKIRKRLREIRTLLGLLSYLEASTNNEGKFKDVDKLKSENYLSGIPSSAIDKINDLSSYELKKFFDIITDFDRVASWNAIDWFDLFLDHFQTTDGKSSIGSLSYYRQNEWRLGLMWSDEKEIVSLHESNEDSIQEIWKFLKEIDSDFFSNKVLEESALFYKMNDDHFFDFVSEIHCPRIVEQEVHEMIEDIYPNKFRKVSSFFSKTIIFEEVFQ